MKVSEIYMICKNPCKKARECVASWSRMQNADKFRPHLDLRNLNSFYKDNQPVSDKLYEINCRDFEQAK